MWRFTLLLGVSLTVVGGVVGDKAVTQGGITTKVKGQSGKIALYPAGKTESQGVTITFDAIKEADADGDVNVNGHFFNSFAKLDFTFSDIEQTTYVNSSVNVAQFSFIAPIDVEANVNATLTSYVYIFKEDGNITVDGEDVEVTSGMMKFNVKIENWPFCNPCTKGNKDYTGEYLDFYINVKSKGTPNRGKNNTFNLGDGATMVNPREILVDNSTVEMMDGYPMFTQQGNKNLFTFRFPKFTESVLYDPIYSLGDTGDNGDPNSAAAHLMSLFVISICLALKHLF